MINSALTWIKPVAGAGLEPTRTETRYGPYDCRLWQLSAARAVNLMGVYSSDMFACRFRIAPSDDPVIRVGWSCEDADGNRYEVLSSVSRNGLYYIELERA